MGFTVKRNVYTLRFEKGSALDGATVRARSVSFGQFTTMLGFADLAGVDPHMSGSEILDMIELGDVAQMTQLLNGFADALDSWDLEDEDGTPIPATREGLHSLDAETAMAIIQPWVMAIAGTSDPLPGGSNSGGPSPAVSLPMEPLSPSRAS